MKKISKWLYIFSLYTWLANMAFIIINLFVDMFAISVVLLFVSVALQGIFSGAFSNNDFALEKTANKTWLDCMVLISKILSAFGMGIGAGSLFIAGGGPEIVGEEYCIVNHGAVVRVISGNWYIYFSVCQYLMLFFGMLIFTTFMFARIRSIFLMQSSNEHITKSSAENK